MQISNNETPRHPSGRAWKTPQYLGWVISQWDLGRMLYCQVNSSGKRVRRPEWRINQQGRLQDVAHNYFHWNFNFPPPLGGLIQQPFTPNCSYFLPWFLGLILPPSEKLGQYFSYTKIKRQMLSAQVTRDKCKLSSAVQLLSAYWQTSHVRLFFLYWKKSKVLNASESRSFVLIQRWMITIELRERAEMGIRLGLRLE